MNEQIKAIGRQAGLVFIEDGVYGQRWYSSKCGLDASEYEKLVQLIVKECADIVEHSRIQGDEGVCLVGATKNKIKQYFRVKE